MYANINSEIKYINECNILMNILKHAKYTNLKTMISNLKAKRRL